ncbi:hypothetical protein A2999_01635 [Candidatus Wolfebacteria bacterium RIFCSPLOWO2_01_FULL_38_11]|uniref:Long-chain-fatty-acid CoA ligase n=2 Tax=Candidatus Wolfeibacteriota TaxID=1752735 RepID=A0A0G0FUX0_9BACT|nr:MAG: Long-chain-fatty-acid CoA ligase [Candidatus Wolfebacteria bacterium GW2011_GWC1_37_10]OGM92153.1 MAG: hypothetical protein A2999_01635 [Candidatus Wolfebacteria bacterium RIFCSPLOWO2_01_FULL_38_11]
MIPRIFQQFTYWPTYLALRILFDYKIEGWENIRGLEEKGVIFASNHASYIDGPICAASMPRESLLPKRFFPVRFIIVDEYYRWNNPFPFPFSIFSAAYVRINGSVPVTRGLNNLQENLAKAVEIVKKGEKLWIFPEGKFTKDGRLQPGKKGVAYLHQETKAPIVPVGIIGNYKILSFKSLFSKNRLKIRIGKPIYSLDSDLEKGVQTIMSEIARLL